MIVFEKNDSEYKVFYSVESDKQLIGTIDHKQLDEHIKYYKSFGNEIEVR